MANFGWSLPPGVSTLPGEEPYYCTVCGEPDFEPDDGLPEDTGACSFRCLTAEWAGYHIVPEGNLNEGQWVDANGVLAVDAKTNRQWRYGDDTLFVSFDFRVIGIFALVEMVLFRNGEHVRSLNSTTHLAGAYEIADSFAHLLDDGWRKTYTINPEVDTRAAWLADVKCKVEAGQAAWLVWVADQIKLGDKVWLDNFANLVVDVFPVSDDEE